MDKIHFAVVGCGHIGKRHAEMITRNAQAKLSALCDIKSSEQLNISHYESLFYNSIDTLLASDLAIDVVNIYAQTDYMLNTQLKCCNKINMW